MSTACAQAATSVSCRLTSRCRQPQVLRSRGAESSWRTRTGAEEEEGTVLMMCITSIKEYGDLRVPERFWGRLDPWLVPRQGTPCEIVHYHTPDVGLCEPATFRADEVAKI